MQDTGAVGINDFLGYSANTEGSRDFTSQTSSLGKPTDDIASNPNTANRIRGLAPADITRDYFYTIGTWAGFDSYNLDEVTIVRGPNSILAGLGSPAGIINYSPQLAMLSGNQNEVSFRYGSYDDLRFTLNSNYVVVPNKLALRVAAVDADTGYEQQPAWNKDKRLYAALTYKPWSKTTIRASYELVKIDADHPNSLTPEDDVTQWIQLGKPTYDSSTGSVGASLTANGTNVPAVIYNKSGTIEGAYNNQQMGYTFYQQNLNNVPLFTSPVRMSSDQYFNLHDVNLNPSTETLKQRTFEGSIDQEIVKGLFANVSYLNEHVDNDYLNLFRTEYAVYSVDVNKYLPGGAPNPHFGETYMLFRGLDNKQTDDNSNEVVRGTLTYNLDLNKINHWLGRYTATGFLEDRQTKTDHLQYNARETGNDAYESISYIYYLGGTADNGYRGLSVPQHPTLVQGVTNNTYDSESGTLQQSPLNTYYGLKSDSKQEVKLSTAAAVFQGFWWDDKITSAFTASAATRTGPGLAAPPGEAAAKPTRCRPRTTLPTAILFRGPPRPTVR